MMDSISHNNEDIPVQTFSVPGANGRRLAEAFAREIRENLTTQQLAHVVLRNEAYARIHGEGRGCATHDFIDSNVCMLDAFKKTFPGTEPDPAIQIVSDLINEAWSLAQNNNFQGGYEIA